MRPISPGDVDLLVELDGDPEVKRFLDGSAHVVRAEVEATVLAALDHRWIAHGRDDGAFVGWFGARPTAPGERELGYRLRQASWGRGLATEGARAVIDWCFGNGVTRVWAQTMAVNDRSRPLLERLGFDHVRTFHVDWPEPLPGSEHGEVEYELRPPDRRP